LFRERGSNFYVAVIQSAVTIFGPVEKSTAGEKKNGADSLHVQIQK
jgi:hypothetical protein